MGRMTRALTVAAAILSLAVAAAGTPTLAGGGTGGAVVAEGDNTSLDFFLDPGDSTLTKDGDFNRSDFGSMSKTLKPASAATSSHGNANASASINATIATFPDDLTTVTATGRISGSAKQNTTTGTAPAFVDVPVASSDSSFSIDFSGNGVPMIVSVSGSASNSDADDCTEIDADFSAFTQDGALDQSVVVAAKGGACPAADGKLAYSGVLTGSGSLSVELGATVDPEEPGSETYSGSFTVSLSFPFGFCTITGTSSGESLNGTGNADVICGMGGTDTIHGNAGNDVIFGGSDADTINGGADDDVIHGAAGADVIQGGPGDDSIFGEQGNDLISDSRRSQLQPVRRGWRRRDLRLEPEGHGGCRQRRGLRPWIGGADLINGGAGNDPGLVGEGSAADALTIGCLVPAGSPGTPSATRSPVGPGTTSSRVGPETTYSRGWPAATSSRETPAQTR